MFGVPFCYLKEELSFAFTEGHGDYSEQHYVRFIQV